MNSHTIICIKPFEPIGGSIQGIKLNKLLQLHSKTSLALLKIGKSKYTQSFTSQAIWKKHKLIKLCQ